MLTWLQILGGGGYLLNKIFLAWSEHDAVTSAARSRTWRIWSWVVYLAGLPAWVIVFGLKRDWIAAALEAGGLPAMVLGLLIAINGPTRRSFWVTTLNWTAIACIPIGLGYSLYDFHGLRTLNQVLEIGLTTGYLVGTYQLAHHRSSGYLWFVLMHIATAILMWRQSYPWLTLQQVVSLVFIIGAYYLTRCRAPEGRAHDEPHVENHDG